MAGKKTDGRSRAIPTDRAMQLGDFDKQGQAVIAHNMAGKGMVKSLMGARIEGAQAAVKTAKETYANKPDPSGRVRLAERKVNNLTNVAKVAEDKPITMAGAVSRRVAAVKAGAARTKAEGDPVTGRAAGTMATPAGAGWYFEHHKAIKEQATKHGYDTNVAITASAVMSPTNSPENEKAAVGALMHAEKNATVHVTPELHAFLHHEAQHHSAEAEDEGAEVQSVIKKNQKLPERSLIGQRVRIGDLDPTHVANLSGLGAAQNEKKSSTRRTLARAVGKADTEADLTQMARGGSKGNIVKAINVLRGHTPVDKAIDPISSPKVHSYNAAIQNAVPGGGIEEEYRGRVHHVLGNEIKGQQRMDLFGLKGSTHGILNPKGNTAEDTWMNTITVGQPDVTIPGTRTLASKEIASDKVLGLGLSKTAPVGPKGENVSAHPHPAVKDATMMHAYNNAATVGAAAKLSKGTGEMLPSVAAQEIGWTEKRRATGKDPAYNEATARTTVPKVSGKQLSLQFPKAK